MLDAWSNGKVVAEAIMSRVTIELAPGTEQTLRAKASANGKSLEFYLQELAQKDALEANGAAVLLSQEELSLADFDQLLDALAAGPPGMPPLPEDFSRRDIYSDHD